MGLWMTTTGPLGGRVVVNTHAVWYGKSLLIRQGRVAIPSFDRLLYSAGYPTSGTAWVLTSANIRTALEPVQALFMEPLAQGG